MSDTVDSVKPTSVERQRSPEMGTSDTSKGVSFEDMVDLRKKYDEVVSFTVSLTAERDQLKELLNAVKKDLDVYREQARVLKQSKTEGNPAATGDLPWQNLSKHYTFWHVVLVAIVAFIVGQLLSL